MADGLIPVPVLRRRVPVWARIAILYGAARLLTAGMLLAAAALSGDRSRFGSDPTIGDFAVGWDAAWYWLIAVDGYPPELPLTATGAVAENAWAFLPVFPFLAGAVGALLGSWGAGAVVISLTAGYGAALVLHALLRERLGETTALWAVAFFVASPVAALFQVGYAESLFLLLLFTALLLVQRRRFGWLYPLVAVLGFTRPGALAFALFLALYGLWRWVRRRTDPLPAVQALHIVLLGLWSAAIGFAWQAVAAAVTGQPDAYLATELAWRRNWIPEDPGRFAPFDGFAAGARFWFELWGPGAQVGTAVLILAVLATAALLLFEPHVRRLPVEIRLWSTAYLVYLLAVFFPQSSIFRLLVPLSPLWGAVAAPASRTWRIGVLLACLAGQWWWIHAVYGQAAEFWQVP